MNEWQKKIFIYFLNKKTNQNSLNFVSMRFFHHRVMFFFSSSPLLIFYFVFITDIGYLNFGPIFCWGHSNHQIPCEIWKIFVRIIISPYACLRNEFKAKIIWLFLFEFRYFFSFCLSTHSLFFSPRIPSLLSSWSHIQHTFRLNTFRLNNDQK